MKTLARLRPELHMAGQFFEPLTHASETVAAGHPLDAASIVACRQTYAAIAAFDCDPEIRAICMAHGVRDDLLHASKKGTLLDGIIDGNSFIDLDVHLSPYHSSRQRANRRAEIRVVTVAKLADNVAHVAEQQAGDRVRLRDAIDGGTRRETGSDLQLQA